MLKQVIIKNELDNKNPKFIKTKLIEAERDGLPFFWEMVKSHDSVHVLVDNIDTKQLFFVKQVRIPVLVNDNSKNGIVMEACAGLVDKNKSLVEIVQEEIIEEIGYCPDIENITKIKTLKSSVGSSGSNSHAFYAQIKEIQWVNDGGGLHDEDIEVFCVNYNDVERLIYDDSFDTDAMTMFLIHYWMLNFYKN